VEVADLPKENVAALRKGIVNLERHIDNMRDRFGLPCVVSINHRAEDTEAEISALQESAAPKGVKVINARHYSDGGAGATEVAKEVVRLCEQPSKFHFLYEDAAPPISVPMRRCTPGSASCSRAVTATIRCAWPRPSIRFPLMPSCVARPAGT
jgi:formyltetrahydrofolate synthetase